MAEYIITSKQLEKMLDAVNSYLMVGELIGYEPSRPVNEVVISGEELPVLVRCRECEHYDDYLGTCLRPRHNFAATPDGFCKWGERKENANELRQMRMRNSLQHGWHDNGNERMLPEMRTPS